MTEPSPVSKAVQTPVNARHQAELIGEIDQIGMESSPSRRSGR
jgi:hypothetical protein